MKEMTRKEVLQKQAEIIKAIKNGNIFIYPTDTIYGIGCDATNEQAVKRVRKIKSQFGQPMSVIAPGKRWINRNLHQDALEKEWVKKLPGPYTLILKPKTKTIVAMSANVGLDTIGVRYPKSWFTPIIRKAGVPFITTSVNKHGEPHLTDPCTVQKAIAKQVDIIITGEKKCGMPSTIVDLSKRPAKLKRRK